MKLTRRIVQYKRSETDTMKWSDTPIREITDAYNVRVNTGIADKKDTFSFQILNFGGVRETWFDDGDNIKIYFGQNNEDLYSNNYLAIDGIVTNISQKITDSGKILEISGKSRSEFLLEGLVFIDAQNKTPPEIVIQVINFLTNLSTAGGSNLQLNWNSNTIPSLKSDGTAHSTFQYTTQFKQAYQILEDISSYEYTRDVRGNYIFYIDNQNYFYFTYRTGTVSATIEEGTYSINEINIKYTADKIINWIVGSAGADPNGEGISIFVFDPASMQKHGPKMKFITSISNTSTDLMVAEKNYNSNSFDDESGFYPTDAALTAGYTTHWISSLTDTINQPTCTAGSVITNINSKKLYTYAVRREVETKATAMCYAIMRLYNNPRFEVKIVLPRTMAYSTANLIKLNAPSHGILDKNLRLIGVQHDDFKTELDLLEDETTIGEA